MARTNDDGHEELILLDFWLSLFSIRVRIALAEKGITNYECREENILVLERSQVLLEMNPIHKLIPVLIHDGRPICESLVIVEYIDEVWKAESSTTLLPSDAYGRARARFWADFIDNKVYPASFTIWRTEGEIQETAKKEFIESLKLLEEELGNKTYFGGDNIGFVDVALLPFYSWFYTYEICANFRIAEECPKIVAWGTRCEQRDAVQRSLPNKIKVSETVMKLRRRLVSKCADST